MNKQIRQLGIFITVLFLILFVQLNNVQLLQASKLNDDPRNNRNAVRDFSSPRGVIQTADGQVIARSVEVDDDYKQLREYPKGDLFGHLTGYFSFNYGSEGLEKVYNDDLTGKTYALKNVGDLLTERVRTNNLTITVDSQLQQLAKDQLANRKGSVVALDPKTGAILAMYSNPSYDPNPLSSHNFSEVTKAYDSLVDASNNPMLPRSYREVFFPGSTFKVLVAAAAYDHMPELTEKTYPSLQSLDLPQSDKSISNFSRNTCGGTIDDLLRVSCNTGFAQMGMDLGAENLINEAEAFGFNQSVPLDLPSPAKSRFPGMSDLAKNKPSQAYSAIGQENVQSTPLQMALVAAAIANDGVIMKPHLLKEIRDNHSDVVESANPEPWRRATSKDTADEVKKLMIQVAQRGTATGARIDGVEVGAKTGTAQTGNNTVHTWLISFASSGDKQVAVAVMLENLPVANDVTGGRLAAPIAQAIMKSVLGKS